jgi:hypothetical protein
MVLSNGVYTPAEKGVDLKQKSHNMVTTLNSTSNMYSTLQLFAYKK